MAIPKHDAIRVPTLKLLQKQGAMELKDFEQPQISGLDSEY